MIKFLFIRNNFRIFIINRIYSHNLVSDYIKKCYFYHSNHNRLELSINYFIKDIRYIKLYVHKLISLLKNKSLTFKEIKIKQKDLIKRYKKNI